MTLSDRKIILNTIQTGEFPRLINLRLDLHNISNYQILQLLKRTDTQKYNYFLAKKIADQLTTEESNLKKNITKLVAIELNHYQDKVQRDKIYGQLSKLLSNLISFPEKKRIVKFLVKFTLTSKALQETVKNNKNFEILKIYNQINSEVK